MQLRTPLDQLQELPNTNTHIVIEQRVRYYSLLTSDLFTSTETILRVVVVEATVSGSPLFPAFSFTMDA
jgi:hypothetical protein